MFVKKNFYTVIRSIRFGKGCGEGFGSLTGGYAAHPACKQAATVAGRRLRSPVNPSSVASRHSFTLAGQNRLRKTWELIDHRSESFSHVATGSSRIASFHKAMRSASAASRSRIFRACCTNRPAVLKIRKRSRLGRARNNSAATRSASAPSARCARSPPAAARPHWRQIFLCSRYESHAGPVDFRRTKVGWTRYSSPSISLPLPWRCD